MSALVSVAERLRKMVPAISVGVLSADLMAVGRDIDLLEKAGVKILHFDVMDGCFCPMITAGPALIKAVKTSLLKDVHLMVQDPLEKLEPFAAAGADMITVHVEACRHPHRVLQAIGQLSVAGEKDRRPLRGIALNPGTTLHVIEPLIDEVDMIFLLAVNPGWGGQKFIGSTQRRMEQLLQMIRESNRDVLVGIDGGITKDNIDAVAKMGADIIVTGSAIFDGKNILQNVQHFNKVIANGQSL
ncbi:MAG: ribulose-phosphate 3-epimerase [Kiritimatiellae bacterium]|nr:ribulose-phosphate 3-epimerase [Kiritimatiellia bacterium]MDD5520973.1 ribulose-phosphate 3-epimerase [Kiritimatiellia bacterium]